MSMYVLTAKDERERKRSMRLSITIHAIILALIFIPFIKKTPPLPDVKAIIVQFSGGGATAGAKSSAGGADAPAVQDVVEDVDIVEPDVTDVVEEVPVEPTPTPPTPPVKTLPSPPVVTSDNSDAPTIPQIKDIKVPEREVPTPPVPEVEETPEVVEETKPTPPVKEIPPQPETKPEVQSETKPTNNKETSSDKKTDRIGKIKDALGGLFGGLGKGDGKSDKGDGKNDGSGNGNADSGAGNDDRGNGGSGEGTGSGEGDGDFEGIGALTREVIYRPAKDYPHFEGAIAVNICIDRSGKPTKVAYNRKESTIRTRENVKNVLNNVAQYRFKPKANAPLKECGIIKITIEDKRNR